MMAVALATCLSFFLIFIQDLVEVEDMEVLHVSAQEILKASVMAEVDVVSRPLAKLLESAKEHASSFTALVPTAFYLPAPPLYCPQPSLNTQVLHSELRLWLFLNCGNCQAR